MTVICAATDGYRVVMAGDRSGISDYDLIVRADEKVFKIGKMVIGFTSSFRMGQLIRYHLEPKPIAKSDPMKYLVRSFIPEIRAIFKEHGLMRIEDSVEEGGCFLIGLYGKIYRVESNFAISTRREPYDAIGAGDEYAMGAMRLRHDLMESGDLPGSTLNIVSAGMESALQFSSAVSDPFDFIESD